ncbi:RDD family protein [Clostridium sp. AL.422]|uniref:RDD family protein n=1 Tax=Clostridium TaxID=1485 RepID=UPI00293DF9B8|nr:MULTISPECIES: RDD family protein [unclassified Clostridium]MDV4149787.1 RDD family protein [Clostridium sp. AL.422]
MNTNYASLNKRAIAFLIDHVLYILLMIPLALIFLFLGIQNEVVTSIIIFLVILVIEFIQLVAFKGRTIGKLLKLSINF